VDPRGYDDVEVDLGVDGLISVAPSRLVSTGPRTVSTCTIEPSLTTICLARTSRGT
jgi:hypothetical protein